MIHLDKEKNICEFSGTAMKLISETGAFLGVLKDEYAERGGDERIVSAEELEELVNSLLKERGYGRKN